MNERIRELAEQTIGANPKYAVAMIMASPELEKFAELIVRECAELATKEYNNYGGLHGFDLLEHFGIES